MSTAAVLLVKSEDDIVRHTVEHLATQVDEILVWDNMSTDNTRPILEEMAADGWPVVVFDDNEIAYEQSKKMSYGAYVGLERGHTWGVMADCDEHWTCADYSRPIREFLNGLAPDIRVVTAELFNHIPTSDDPPVEELDLFSNEVVGGEPNPFRRIGWRKRERAPLPKVAVKLCRGMEIAMGNHAAYLPGPAPSHGGLVVRHYSWRSRRQYIEKISTGARAYALTKFPEGVGAHWRMFGLPPEDPDALAEWEQRVGDHFEEWFYSADPAADDSMIYDPAPLVEG